MPDEDMGVSIHAAALAGDYADAHHRARRMTIVRDWGIFDDAKGRRCIAYNADKDHCLNLSEDGVQTIRLEAPGERCMILDAPYSKVRNMVVPYNRNEGSPDRLPIGVPVFFRARFTIAGNYQRMTAWWFLPLQLQRVLHPTQPPASLHVERNPANNMEYWRAWICRDDIPDGIALDTRRVPVKRDVPIDADIEFKDAAGGPDGRMKVTIAQDDGPPVVICDYAGPTGYREAGGLYPGWGIYGADQWAKKQLPLVMRFEALDWGVIASPEA